MEPTGSFPLWLKNFLQRSQSKRHDRTSKTLRTLPKLQLDVKSWKQSVFTQAELPLPQPFTITNTIHHADVSDDTKDWHLSLPCNVRLTQRPTGLDLRLHLFNLRIGDPSSPTTLHQSSISTTHSNNNSNIEILDRAAGLLFAKVLFPDTISPTLHFATVSWCATALLKHTSKHFNLTHPSSPLQKLHNNLNKNNSKDKSWTKTTLAPLMTSTFKAMGSLAQKYGEPAAWLTAAAAVWAIVNPSSYKVGECIAALIPVLAGYNQTARQCEKGLIADQEGAWYGVHRWAARRTAHLLTRLPSDNPPLGPLMDVWEGLDIRVGSSRINNNNRSGWATAAAMQHYNGGGSEFWASISLGGGNGSSKGVNKKHITASKGTTAGSIVTEKINGETHSASVASTPLKTGKSLSSSASSSGAHHRLSSGNLMDSPADWSSSPRASSDENSGSEDGIAVGTTSSNENNNNNRRSNNNDVVSNSLEDDDGVCWLDDDETSAALAEVTAALYGRADHLLGDDAEEGDGDEYVGIVEKLRLTVRGIHLVALFAPFIMFGTVLLLAASSIAARRHQRIERKRTVMVSEGEKGSKDDGITATTKTTITITPPSSTPCPSSVPIDARMRTAAFKLLLWACRQSGAAFIKWGQWASTREDIFPDDFCRILSNLHDQAPEHSYQQSRSIIEQSFNGKTIEDMFVWFDPVPLASGSIAQVHKAGLRMGVADGRPLPPSYDDADEGGESVVHTVAVKVRHPGVARRIWEDFQVLRPFAAMTSRVKSLKGLGLKDTVSQFSHTMTAQADLRIEAAHLTRFYNNFKSLSSSVVVPKPIRGMTREAVLVETFEPGLSVAKFIRQPAPCNTKIVSIGVDTYLKMLLCDNFVHTDLHPGNILVRPAPTAINTNSAGDGSNKKKSIEDIMMKEGDSGPVQLILLDFGLAEELTPRVRRHFIGFLNAISAGDGPTAAGHLLSWSTRQKCPDPAALIADVEELFQKDCNIHQPGGIDLDHIMKSILHLARRHEVSIDSGYAALVVGVCVIVGFATGLDPRVNLMDAATPCMLYYNLTGRVAGRLFS